MIWIILGIILFVRVFVFVFMYINKIKYMEQELKTNRTISCILRILLFIEVDIFMVCLYLIRVISLEKLYRFGEITFIPFERIGSWLCKKIVDKKIKV